MGVLTASTACVTWRAVVRCLACASSFPSFLQRASAKLILSQGLLFLHGQKRRRKHWHRDRVTAGALGAVAKTRSGKGEEESTALTPLVTTPKEVFITGAAACLFAIHRLSTKQ